jgi:hypothetical protein
MTEPVDGRLPDFVIIGAARAGTTAIWEYLRAHPGAFLPIRKELNFFHRVELTPETLAWYRGQFAEARPEQAAGEASPQYLFYDVVPERMASVIPNAKLVASLRDPVDRAYSHYWWRRLWRAETREFAEAVDDELAGTAPPGGEYLGYGLYREQLDRFCAVFPRSALHVTLLDDLEADASGTLASVCRHLGIAEVAVPPARAGQKVNATSADIRSAAVSKALARWQWRSGWRGKVFRMGRRLNRQAFEPPEMEPEMRARLHEHFALPNAELARWLDRDLQAWSG